MSWRDEPKRWYSVSKCGCAHTSTNHPWVVRQTSLPGECVHVCDDHKPKANPMTDITLEQRARELLESTGASISTPDEVSSWMEVVRLDDVLTAIEAALRLSAGADWVLVPREPTPEMLDAGWAEGAKLCESGAPDFAAAWTAMLAAAPRHEPGEGS